ncbi:MAG: hypothetical protein PHP07_06485 [Eubacteriales bacterium]|nr:hypothetical protein [Eubacteriales bacterium]
MVTIRVPASCANLGPGFDCLGMALGLYADIRFGPREGGLVITGCPPVFSGEDNLAYRAFLLAAKAFGKKAPGLEVDIRSDIPPARGAGQQRGLYHSGHPGRRRAPGRAALPGRTAGALRRDGGAS